MATSQSKRAIRVQSPFGSETLLFADLSGSEHLSAPYAYELGMLSESGDLDPDQILGRPISVGFQPAQGDERRFIHGVVTEFAQTGFDSRYHHYRATVRPWLWFLTRTADCRIFQQKSIPEIFEAVAKEYGFTDYRLSLQRTYPAWEFCVQYRETDFNFVSRLLEQEGIYYFFEHFEDRHELVLVDDPSQHKTREGYAKVPYYAPGANDGQRERDHLSSWAFSRTIQPGAYALTEFDFEQPHKALAGKATLSSKHARADFEMFDFPAELQIQESSETERIARVRMEELQATRSIARGSGNAGGLAAGGLFTLEKFPRKDLNIEYLVVGTRLSMSSDAYQSGGGGADDAEINVSIEAIDSKVSFKPSRVTPKPSIQGTQTALVVGKAGEEIWTDKYGRVKVQFHWDRYGKKDENSSCWIRVAQVWAGDRWGAMHIPRIGQEVIVSFLEGDPDQPIITGRVYNGAAMPPYGLPENQTQSGIKSRSSKGGTAENFNEIRFEDKKGEELLVFHAEKDLKADVEHDQSIKVGHDETVDVGHDRKDKVGHDETLEVGNDQKASIASNETRTVGKDRKTDVGQSDTVKVGKRYVLEAGDEIVLKTGSAQLTMKKDGSIVLKGVKIKIDAADSLTEKAGQKIDTQAMQINAKGTKVQVQGTMLDLKASAIATLKGSLTKIG